MARVCYLCALLGLSLFARADDWEYTVRPGDNLWDLAAHYCGSVTFASKLARHNGISSPEALELQPGKRVLFPVQWLVKQPVSARLIFVTGVVSVERGTDQRTPAVEGGEITMNDALVTADGHATVAFADRTELVVGPDSRVFFDLMTAYSDTGMVDTKLRLVRGRVDSRVQRSTGPGSDYRINTPLGVAAVRGTRFRVRSRMDEARGALMFNETIEGEVAVDDDASQSSALVQAGFGVVADAQPQPPQLEQLLPPPPMQGVGLAAATDRLEWSPVPGAAAYLVRVYGGGDRRRPFSQSLVTHSWYGLSALTPGQYGFGVRAVSVSGLEGLEAAVDVRLVAAAPAPHPLQLSGGEKTLTLRWTDPDEDLKKAHAYSISLARDPEFETASVYSSTATQLQLPMPAPGIVFWRVARVDDGVSSDPVPLEVPPHAPSNLAVSNDKRSLSVHWSPVAGAQEYQLEVSLDPEFSQGVRSTTTTQSDAVISVGARGRHHVRVRAMTDGVAGVYSDAVEHQIAAPWWPIALFAVPFLAL